LRGFCCSVFDPNPWNRIRIGIQPKMMDPDPDPCQMNTDPKQWSWQTLADSSLITKLKIIVSNPHWFQCGSGSGILANCGSGPRSRVMMTKNSVWRIRDVYHGSRIRIFPSRIPDPNCLHPGSRILIKEFKYFNPQKSKKNGF
jgi:hypothetical protein